MGPVKYKHFVQIREPSMMNDGFNGPHSDCVTNKINIQNDFLKSRLLLSELQMIFLLNILSVDEMKSNLEIVIVDNYG